MASYKKNTARRARRINQPREEREHDLPMMPDFLIRRLSVERLKMVTNRTVLQHWHD